MSSGADKENEICRKSPDNRHNYQKNLNSRETACIYCGDVLTTEAKQAAGVRTGDAILHEIPGNEKAKTDTAPKCPGRLPLDNLGINALTGALETYGRIMAIQARIDGMKIHNTICGINGHDRVYSQIDFTDAADNIYKCTQELRLMKEDITR